MKALTVAQLRLLSRLATASEGDLFEPAPVREMEALGLVTIAETGDGDFYEITPAGRAALKEDTDNG